MTKKQRLEEQRKKAMEIAELCAKIICEASVVDGKPVVRKNAQGRLEIIEENFPKPRLDPNNRVFIVKAGQARTKSTTLAEVKVACPKCGWKGLAVNCAVNADRYFICPKPECLTHIKIAEKGTRLALPA